MAIEAVPVDVKLRRGVHPVPDAFLDIALYPVRVRPVDDLVAEPLSLQPDLRRVADQGLQIELRGGPQQELVHIPEFVLRRPPPRLAQPAPRAGEAAEWGSSGRRT